MLRTRVDLLCRDLTIISPTIISKQTLEVHPSGKVAFLRFQGFSEIILGEIIVRS